jgi:copper transport protein
VALALVATFAAQTTAFGHAEYDHSAPNSGQTVFVAPTHVDVFFDEDLDPTGHNVLNVLAPGNVDVDNNDTAVDALDHTKMSITLQGGLAFGVYTVEWENTADDGDQEEGSFTFTYAPGAVGGVGFESELAGTTGSTGGAWLVAGLASATLAAVLAAGWQLRRRQDAGRSQ